MIMELRTVMLTSNIQRMVPLFHKTAETAFHRMKALIRKTEAAGFHRTGALFRKMMTTPAFHKMTMTTKPVFHNTVAELTEFHIGAAY